MDHLKITCLCCTYRRPRQLEEAIECFLRQDYPKSCCELLILDDAGQYNDQGGENWQLWSLPRRFLTLAEKTNALAGLASTDTNVYAIWDDDDIYLPWHLSAIANAMSDADWTVPSTIMIFDRGHLVLRPTRKRYHSSWAFRRTAFAEAQGYPLIEGADQAFGIKLRSLNAHFGDSNDGFAPSVIYRWGYADDAWHVSESAGRYETIVEELADPGPETLTPGWTRDWESLATDFLATLQRRSNS